MNCFECAIRGETVAAVSTCRHCGVGLCLEHLAEAASYRVGGTIYGCPHDLRAAERAIAARTPRGNGRRVQVPTAAAR